MTRLHIDFWTCYKLSAEEFVWKLKDFIFFSNRITTKSLRRTYIQKIMDLENWDSACTLYGKIKRRYYLIVCSRSNEKDRWDNDSFYLIPIVAGKHNQNELYFTYF
jgi:hypothetical protein